MSNPTLTEIAGCISSHLHRLEADTEGVNKPTFYIDRNGQRQRNSPKFYYAHASRAGRYVKVCYVSYQGETNLTRDEALEYLTWLETGGTGSHFAMQYEQKEQS